MSAREATRGRTHNTLATRRVLEEAFPADDETLLAQLVTDDVVNHMAPPGTPPGLGSIAFPMHALARAFSDQKWTIHRILEDGDMVAVHCTHSGRHTGDFFGLPATGRTFSYEQMHMSRMVDGRTAEVWEVRDDAALMRQLTGTPRR